VKKPTRYRISQRNGHPMGIAGIWYEHPSMKDKAGKPLLSFAMLTVNADGHPVFKRMHKPGDEKRMVVILAQEEYDRWLNCSVAEASSFFRQWQGELDAMPAPLPERGSRAKKAEGQPPEEN
jgi:putative SOS response-associated peptidase YedK